MAKVYGDELSGWDQFKKLKDAPLKDKIMFIWEYYRIQIIIGIALIILGLLIADAVVRSKRPYLIAGEVYTEYIDQLHPDEILSFVAEAQGLNPRDYQADISASGVPDDDAEMIRAQQMKMMAHMVAADLDFLVAPELDFGMYMDPEDVNVTYFGDLRDFIDEADFKAFEEAGRVRYFESKELGTYPYLIEISGTDFCKTYNIIDKEIYIGFPVNAPHLGSIRVLPGLFNK